MIQRGKRCLSFILALCLIFAVLSEGRLYAEAEDIEDVSDGDIETVVQDDSDKEALSGQDLSDDSNSSEINYILVESPYLETPDMQRIFLSYGDGSAEAEIALEVVSPDGEIEIWESTECVGHLYLFEKYYDADTASGVCEVLRLRVNIGQTESFITLSDFDMQVLFGINTYYDGYEDLIPLGEDASASGVTVQIDSDSEDASSSVAQALQTAQNELASGISTYSVSGTSTSETSGNYVVALDPGHDSTHAGASGNGLKEHELTLKIAQYCKEELEKYDGITVYMTRTSSSCPYPGTSASANDIQKRVEASVDAGACVYVSFHINDSTSGSAKGASVIIPNRNWNSDVADDGYTLAEKILNEISAAGMSLQSNAIYSQNTTSGSKYADGSTSDDFAVQRYCKLNGIPGVIVEHGYINNKTDVSKFLGSESGLKALGVADAKGIIEYLGASPKTAFTVTADSNGNLPSPVLTGISGSSSGIKVSWDKVNGAAKYRVFRKTGDGSWKKLADISASALSYTDTTAKAGTTYTYTVRCINSSGSKYTSSYDKTGLTLKYAAVPKLETITANGSGIQITWNKASGAKMYRVFRKTGSGGWTKLADVSSSTLTYKDKTAKAGTEYTYTVRCISSDGKTYTGGYDKTGLTLKYAAAPTLGKITGSSSGIQITWSKASGATKYRVFRKTGSGSWKKLADVSSSTLSYTDKTAKAGTTYTYTVRCINSKGTSYTSGYDSSGLKLKYAATPKLTGVSNVNGGVKITWNKATGAAKYRVFRKISGGSWKKVADTTSLNYTDKTAKNNTKYIYTVRCVTSDGKAYAGGYDRSGKSVTYLTAPTLKSISGSSNGITVKWDKVSGAAKYRVFRKTSGGSWEKLKDTTSLSYTDKTAKAGTTYIYTVRCINSKGTAYTSGYDSTGLKLKYAATPEISNLTSDEEGVVIKWSAAAGAEKYKVFRRSSSSDSWKAVGTTTSTSYTDQSVAGKEKTTYYYTVRCVTSDGKTYTGGYTVNGKSIKTGYYKSSTTAAYDEPVYEENDVYVCSRCGYSTTDMAEMTFHLEDSENCTDYTVESQTLQSGTIHHDAVTTKTWVTNQS